MEVVVGAGVDVATAAATGFAVATAGAGVLGVEMVAAGCCLDERLRDVDNVCVVAVDFSDGDVSLDGVDARESDWFESGFFGLEPATAV